METFLNIELVQQKQELLASKERAKVARDDCED